MNRSLAVLVAFTLGVMAASAAEVNPAPSSPSKGESAGPRIQVTLISDGETWVSITGVQVPEKFQTKKVSLPVGDFEVVGRRKGYRDVMATLEVRSGTTPKPLTIVCTVNAAGSR